MFVVFAHAKLTLYAIIIFYRVMQLNQEIEKVKEAQLAGYGRGGATEQNVQLNLGALAALDAADLAGNGESICALTISTHRGGRWN